jgi:DNA repair protein RadC
MARSAPGGRVTRPQLISRKRMKKQTRILKNGSARAAVLQAQITRAHSPKPPAQVKVIRLRECPVDNPILDTSDAVEKFWREHVTTAPWFSPDKECLCAFALNSRHRLLGFEMVSQGTLNTLLVRPAEVFRFGVVQNAAAVIVAHNHPSGDPTPSKADIAITKTMIAIGGQLDIKLLDHVIIGSEKQEPGYVSLTSLGLFVEDCGASPETEDPCGHGELESAVNEAHALIELLASRLTEPPGRDEGATGAGIVGIVLTVTNNLRRCFEGAWSEWQKVKGVNGNPV